MAYEQQLTKFPKKMINMLSSGATKIGTTENGTQKFFPQWATITVATANALISLGSVSIGTNSPNYNNLLGTTLLTGLDAVNATTRKEITGVIGAVEPNTDIYVNVSGLALGASYQVEVTLWGFYQ